MFNMFLLCWTFARVLPLEPGPAHGFFLIKGGLVCHTCFPGVTVWLLVRCLETVLTVTDTV